MHKRFTRPVSVNSATSGSAKRTEIDSHHSSAAELPLTINAADHKCR